MINENSTKYKIEERTAFIDGIKVFLCLVVAVGHFYNFLGGRYIYGIRLIGGMGAKAVDVFFFLSAFLTTLSYQKRKRNATELLVHRLRRLYPEYLPILIIAFLTYRIRSIFQENTLMYFTGDHVGAFGGVFLPQPIPEIKSLLPYLFFCNGFFQGPVLLPVAWSLPVEVWFFVIFALVTAITKGNEERMRAIFIILYLIFVFVGIYISLHSITSFFTTVLLALPIMLMGVIFAELFQGKIRKLQGWICVTVGLLYLCFLDIRQNWLSVGIIVIIIVLLKVDIRGFALIRSFLSRPFFHKGCILSYSIYLIHTIVISMVFGGLVTFNEKTELLSKKILILLAFILSCVFTILSAWVINRTFLFKREKR